MQIANLTGLLSTGIYYGLYVSNDAGTPNTVIDIAAGAAVDSQQAQIMVLPTAFTKSLASTWVQGTGNGGLDTGSIAANTWYYAWLIMNPTTGVVDVLLSVSSTSPTMPSGFTWSRRIRGAFKTDASSHILGFNQTPNYIVVWNSPLVEFTDTNPGTSSVTKTLGQVPPLIVEHIGRWVLNGNTANLIALIRPLFQTDQAPSSSVAPLYDIQSYNIGTLTVANELKRMTNASAQLAYRISASGGGQTIAVATIGWLEPLS